MRREAYSEQSAPDVLAAFSNHLATLAARAAPRTVGIRLPFMETGMAADLAVASPAEAAPAAGAAHYRSTVSFTLNGERRRAEVANRTTVLDWLRQQAGLTGVKKGCNEGACGTCTVLIDGKRMNACLTLVVQCAERDIVTIEGIAGPGGALHPVQQSFIDHDAFQCGYCTPGQILSAIACIQEGHATDEASVREWMSGNICRCAAYPQIIAAVLDGAGKMKV
jgi:xanthine dehydrogenase YagT iron-sulfur-binding subunit